MAKAKGSPPRHGDISVSTMPKAHMRQHLASMTASAGEVAGYHRGGGEVTGQNWQGSFSGNSSGAQYSTTNVGSDVGDADTGGT